MGQTSALPTPMPLISRNVPAFSSGNANVLLTPDKSNDADTGLTWIPDKLPGWIAYDLSAVPADKRQQVLIAWYAVHAGAYLIDNSVPSDQSPIDYTIEMNAGPGGGQPPTDGWQSVAVEKGNTRSMRQHLTNLKGGNWIRMTVTKATDAQCSFDLDVHSAPDGASDSWLFMGDSITHLTTLYNGSDIPSLVNKANPERWPAITPAGIGGTSTGSALDVIDETLKYFPGRFVVLGYGTNNTAQNFAMEPLVQKVLAAGKIPAIPHIPWSSQAVATGDVPKMNAAIDALYLKYPEIFRGPDLWTAFENRTDLIPTGDVHPNAAGQEVFRQKWAAAMSQ